MIPRPEFSRIERIDTIGEATRTIAIEAGDDERRRLAGRFGLLSVERLAADYRVRRDAAGIVAEGRVIAAVTQACAVSGAAVPAEIDEPVALRFVAPAATAEEIELDAVAIDTIEIEDDAIDLGESAAETMALALDPFPRAPDAEAALRAAGVTGEDEGGAFGALAALRDRLSR